MWLSSRCPIKEIIASFAANVALFLWSSQEEHQTINKRLRSLHHEIQLTPPNPTFFPQDNEKDILPFLKTLFLKYLIGQEYLIKFLIYLFKETEVWISKKYIFIKLSKQFKMKNLWLPVFSCESDSRIANVRLSIRLSVCLSQKPLSLSELLLLTNEPINHQAYLPSSHRPSSLSTIYRLSDLLSRLLSHFGLFGNKNFGRCKRSKANSRSF